MDHSWDNPIMNSETDRCMTPYPGKKYEVTFSENISWSFSFGILSAGDDEKNDLRCGSLPLSFINIPARFINFGWRGGVVTRWLQKGVLVVSFFYLEVSCWFAKRHNHRFNFFYKTVATREIFYSSHYHLHLRLCLIHSHVTNGSIWFTIKASFPALQRQISRNYVQHRIWMGTVFSLLS